LAVVPYLNSFSAGFTLDSKALILDDARVHEATRANVALIVDRSYWWPQGESGLYRPLTTLSYLFNYAVLGNHDRPAASHARNLTVHVVNVLLAFALLVRLTGRGQEGRDGQERLDEHATWVCASIAAVWAVHPLSTEAVTNIVGRADLLAATGVLAGL